MENSYVIYILLFNGFSKNELIDRSTFTSLLTTQDTKVHIIVS